MYLNQSNFGGSHSFAGFINDMPAHYDRFSWNVSDAIDPNFTFDGLGVERWNSQSFWTCSLRRHLKNPRPNRTKVWKSSVIGTGMSWNWNSNLGFSDCVEIEDGVDAQRDFTGEVGLPRSLNDRFNVVTDVAGWATVRTGDVMRQ